MDIRTAINIIEGRMSLRKNMSAAAIAREIERGTPLRGLVGDDYYLIWRAMDASHSDAAREINLPDQPTGRQETKGIFIAPDASHLPDDWDTEPHTEIHGFIVAWRRRCEGLGGLEMLLSSLRQKPSETIVVDP